jgi:hypothetical protein
MPDQPNWRFCDKCGTLFFDGNPDNKGRCAGGGAHEASGFHFVLTHDEPPPPNTQPDWRFCDKCSEMFFEGNPNISRCPAGGAHEASGFHFVLTHDVPPPPNTQPDWRFCDKCGAMFFDGNPNISRCAAGGPHNASGFKFVLAHVNEIHGFSKNSTGVFGESATGIGVHGKGGNLAGLFEGDVKVTGDVQLANADCAEDFDIANALEPGTVMILSGGGALRESDQPYDKRVAGVISGASDFGPGIVLDRHESQTKRLPIGLLGKVYCKVEAESSPIEVGDLLTTSYIAGHAMKASDPLKAFGAVIGKALRPLAGGQGLIPILVALQ